MSAIRPREVLTATIAILVTVLVWEAVVRIFRVPAFLPIVIVAATGMRAADPELLDLVKVLNGSRWQEFVKIRFPYSLPFIFSGLKVAITLAVIGAIIGEFVGGNEGLGYLIVIANAQLKTAMSFSSFILL